MLDTFQCTKDTPWKPQYGGRARHHEVEEIGDQEDGYPGGDIVTRRCLNCGHTWKEELPQ